jgi:hypothetical protein
MDLIEFLVENLAIINPLFSGGIGWFFEVDRFIFNRKNMLLA